MTEGNQLEAVLAQGEAALLEYHRSCMVHVKNASPDSDGTFREYFLRVPPNVGTAREAVAWTFNLRGEQYRPNIES
ncbi:MAG TPA: hypothetical protein V6D17_14080 [Candidatus Obscuribacterales bacterium]